jgi:hypothetical protein
MAFQRNASITPSPPERVASGVRSLLKSVLILWLACSVSAVYETAPLDAQTAQTVRGRVIDEATGAPIAFALVQLLDSAGGVARRSQTDSKGLFALQITGSFSGRIRAEAIGYDEAQQELANLQDIVSAPIVLALHIKPISLPAVGSGSERTCRINESASAILDAWTEARRTLSSTQLAEQREDFTYHGYRFIRRVNSASAILTQSTDPFTTSGSDPFVSLAPDVLLEKGYIQRRGPFYEYYAPNAAVLLSPEFENSHCFELKRSKDKPDLIGIAFSPGNDFRDVPGISGTAWLERKTMALQKVDFQYVNTGTIQYADLASGAVELRVVPGVGWIVQRWKINTPVAVDRKDSGHGVFSTEVSEFREQGGEVTAITAAGVRTGLGSPGSIRGVAYDSTRGRILPNAVVALAGTGVVTRSDSAGRFAFSGIPAGTYVLELRHTRLDSLPAYTTPGVRVHVMQDSTVDVTAYIPPLSRSVLSQCDDDGSRERTVPVYGVLHEAVTGKRVGRVMLTLVSRHFSGTSMMGRTTTTERYVKTDDLGRFMVCDVPAGQTIEIHASDTSSGLDYMRTERTTTDRATFWDLELTPQGTKSGR